VKILQNWCCFKQFLVCFLYNYTIRAISCDHTITIQIMLKFQLVII